MTLRSMTGFARREGSRSSVGLSWVWELRSVNGKGLDVRLRLPQGFEQLEHETRQYIGAHLSRGHVQLALTVQYENTLMAEQRKLTVANPNILNAVLKQINAIDEKIHTRPSSAAEILALRGVMEINDIGFDEETKAQNDKAILSDLYVAVEDFIAHRSREGTALKKILQGQITTLVELIHKAATDPSLSQEVVLSRLREQLARILEEETSLDETRLYQEAALLVVKADIREELDRLQTHCQNIMTLLATGSPIGRKLEFLAQELNRECNTLCAKSTVVSLTEIGLEMKLIVDQFKEQVFNVE